MDPAAPESTGARSDGAEAGRAPPAGGGGPSAQPPLARASIGRPPAERAAEAKRRARRKWLRRAIWAVVVLAAVVAVVAMAMPKPVPIDVVSVRRGPMRVVVNEAGRARVRDRFVVSAPFAGSLGRIELRAGDSVKEGQALATVVPAEPPLLDPRTRAGAEARVASTTAVRKQAEATVRRAEAALEDARRELATSRALAASGSGTAQAVARGELEVRMREEELASSRFATQVAVSEIAAARAALGLLDPRGNKGEVFEIPAPVAGRVLRVLHADAGVVAAGTPIVELGNPDALEVVVDVLTADAARIVPGAVASLEAWGGPPLAAHVRRVEPSATTRLSALGIEEQRVSVLLDLDAPRGDWSALGDGWRVEVSIVVWSTADARVAPSGALFRSGDGWAAFEVDRGRAYKRAVRIGQRSGTEVEVVDGLGDGAALVLHPGDKVADGTRVAPR